jgi:hypothetical protein
MWKVILAMVHNIIFKIAYEYNETTIQVQKYKKLLILIQYCDYERYLHVTIYYDCYHNIRLMSKRSFCIIFFYYLFKCFWFVNVCCDVPWKTIENLNT